MRLAYRLAILAILATATHAAYAAPIILDTDSGVYFYGMDDSGDVVFQISEQTTRCPSPAVVYCYETITNGVFKGYSDTAPTLNWDYGFAICEYPLPGSAPCVASDNGWTAVAVAETSGGEGLYGYYGSNPLVLLFSGGFGNFAINGLGDVVFDNGLDDIWEETAIPTPEPGSIVLLATGILGIAGAARRRFPFHS